MATHNDPPTKEAEEHKEVSPEEAEHEKRIDRDTIRRLQRRRRARC